MATPAAAPIPSRPGRRRSPLARAVARRRNPLWRSTDAWRSRIRVLLGLGLVAAACLSALFALSLYRDSRAAAQRTAATLRPVAAVALSDADQRHPGTGSTFSAEVRWTTASGAARQARAGVDPSTAEGDRVTVWLDRTGRPAPAPTSQADSAGNAAFLGLLTLLGTGTLVLTGAALTRAQLNRTDLRHWDQDWKQTAPAWTGRRP